MPGNNIKVSVVIPTYKVEQYIERCARSLFEQTLDSIEYIFVDDCSPDNSIAVMQKVLEEYPHRKDQVKIIRHEVNQGVGAARNHGVAACSGDYIIHCDPDDWVDLNMYENMYNKAVECSADMVYCDYYKVDENKTTFVEHSGSLNRLEVLTEFFCDKSWGSLVNHLFSREIAKSSEIYCPDCIIVQEDLLRVAQMIKMCKKIIYINQPFYYYWQRQSSILHSWNREKTKCILEVSDLLIEKFNDILPKDVLMTRKILTFAHCVANPKNILHEEYIRYRTKIKIIDVLKNLTTKNYMFFVFVACLNFPLGCGCFKLFYILKRTAVNFF